MREKGTKINLTGQKARLKNGIMRKAKCPLGYPHKTLNGQNLARLALVAVLALCPLWYMDLAFQFQRVYWLFNS